MADVIAISGRWNSHCYTCNIYGRCYCQSGIGGRATRVVGWCDGRWNCQNLGGVGAVLRAFCSKYSMSPSTDGGTTGAQSDTNEVKNMGQIVIPYTQGLCESIKKICGRYGIQTHFKGGRTIKSLLVSPRTKTLWSTKVVPSTGTNVVT